MVDKEGVKITGLKTRETAEELDITKATGEIVTIAKNDIKEIEKDEISSLMPADLTEALTIKDFQDVLAYLMMQKEEEKTEPENEQ